MDAATAVAAAPGLKWRSRESLVGWLRIETSVVMSLVVDFLT
jgi:hypothetical protein